MHNELIVDPPAGDVTRARANLAALERLMVVRAAGVVTAEDRAVLAGWSGWGPMARALDDRVTGEPWASLGRDVKILLSTDEWKKARAATPTSFYTPAAIITAVWELLADLGVQGPVLEPGCGSGRWLAAAPAGVSLVGVEPDPISAELAALAVPGADIIPRPLQEAAIRVGSMGAAVGNVPFADVRVWDQTRSHPHQNLHNYCIARAIEATRHGGIVAVLTSRYTMDSESVVSREAFAAEATLLGAVRFPADAFGRFGTSVVADLLVFQVGTPDPHPERWVPVMFDGGVPVSPWFYNQRHLVLGDMSIGRGMYGREDLVVADTGGWQDRLPDVLAGFAERATPIAGRAAADDGGTLFALDTYSRKEGSFHVDDGGIIQVQDGQVVPVRNSAELRALIGVRDAVLDLLDLEADFDLPDSALDHARATLNDRYDRYVAKHGPLNRCTIVERGEDPETGLPLLSRRRASMGGFRADPDYVTVLAVEDYDDATGAAHKGPIFTERVNRRPERVGRVATVEEAIAVSMDRAGCIDVGIVAGLLGISDDAALERLGGAAFEDPASGRWVPADEYLAGNVRVKLAAAKAAVAKDPGRFHRNVVELTRIQPADLAPEEIQVRLGTPWVDAEDVQLFLEQTIGGKPIVGHEPVTATWQVDIGQWERGKPNAVSTWGTTRMDAYRLAEHALNSSSPIVYDEIGYGSERRKVRNVDETMVAAEKLAALSARFGEWVWEDPARADRLATRYNETFNSTVLRHFDGAHLSFDGMAAWFKPYPHQLDQVYRSISTPAALCGHPVGAGKTAVMAMTAVKLRDLGLARKPAAVVPNHLLEQVAREVKALFPLRRVLMITKDDTAKERRKLFAAKVATGDWDLVVMTHSAFTSIGTGPKVESEYLAERIATYEEALFADGADKQRSRARSLKSIAKSVERMRERHRALLDHREDDGVSWEQLGVDYLLVDEAHYFKNLGFPTRVQGLSLSASKRAEDLHLKLWHLRQRSGGARWGTLLSGTLVSNTLAELFVLQTYAQPDRLAELGIDAFDAWAGTFVEFETRIEVAPDGGSFRMHRRPSKFCNVPELRRIFGEVADIRNRASLGLAGPKVEPDTVVIPPTPELKAYVDQLVKRADKLRSGGGMAKPGEDNMLVICTDGRKAALDLELVGVRSDGGKAPVVVERMLATWRKNCARAFLDPGGAPSAETGVLQVGFCDLGTPNQISSQVYGKIRDGLVAGGMPIGRIRFIHDAKTDTAKAALFADCRAGKVSVLLGSTDKLGVGTNIQHRMAHIHHIDAPWRPADVEQRLGRGDRPGNQCPVLAETKYVREGSFDAYMWQTLERKARFIAQVLTGDLAAREVEDVGESVLSYTEVKALATGNPLIMEQAEAAAVVMRLRKMAAAHARSMRRITGDAEHQRSVADRYEHVAERMVAVADLFDRDPDGGWVSLARRGFTVTDDAAIAESVGERLWDVVETDVSRYRDTEHIGWWHGVPLFARISHMADKRLVLLAGTDVYRSEYVEIGDVAAKSVLNSRFRLPGVIASGFAALRATADERLLDATRLRASADTADQAVVEFPQAGELAAAEGRLAAVEAAIAAELDTEQHDQHDQPAPAA